MRCTLRVCPVRAYGEGLGSGPLAARSSACVVGGTSCEERQTCEGGERSDSPTTAREDKTNLVMPRNCPGRNWDRLPADAANGACCARGQAPSRTFRTQ